MAIQTGSNITFDPARSAGWTAQGLWNSGTAYAQGSVVSYLGGSYVAVSHVDTGGQSPAVDTANWAQIVSGGGEIAGPAEATANFTPTMTAGALFDFPGMSLAIPAGSPAYMVVAEVPMIQFTFAAGATASTQATVRLLLVDEANVALAQSIVRVSAGAASAVQWQQSEVSRKMPATPAAKTIKLSGWLDTVANVTSIAFWAGAGTGTPPGTGTLGPISMVARAR